jgi:hypothetical protein
MTDDPLARIIARTAVLRARLEAERRAEVAEWVRRSCAEQGVPVTVTDPATIKKVVVLLRGGRPPEVAPDA